MQKELLKPDEWEHYPSRQQIDQLFTKKQVDDDTLQITPGYIYRTDGLSAAQIDHNLEQLDEMIAKTHDKNMIGLRSRISSVSDLTQKLYAEFNLNPNDIANWLPQLEFAVATAQQPFFKIPKTTYLQLQPELSQFMRIEYQDTNKRSRDYFNQILFDLLQLDASKEYFIKTGTFSSKFEFRNAHLTEPLEVGEYFQVINNFAMTVGAGRSNTVVAREWIPDVDHRPTIYNGMPLRTEFRFFVDFDTNTVIDAVPYWNPIVMKRALQMQASQADFNTYLALEDTLMREYNEWQAPLTKQLQKLLPAIDLKGRYSLDVMKNGDDFYIIDMALMSDSALTELIDPQKLDQADHKRLD